MQKKPIVKAELAYDKNELAINDVQSPRKEKNTLSKDNISGNSSHFQADLCRFASMGMS